MVFPVAGGTQSTGYEVDNSLRLNRDDSPYLSKTYSSNATDRQKNTFSVWVKRSEISTGSGTGDQVLFSNADNDQIAFEGDTDQLIFKSAGTLKIRTNNRFRDPSAWYHILFAMDTTQGTGSNRIKFYVNGDQVTSFETYTAVNQNTNHSFFINQAHSIGRSQSDTNRHFSGYIAEVHGIDGQQLDPTYFGETSEHGMWIPKKYAGTFGNNGFKFIFADSSAPGTDSSGAGGDWSSNNLAALDTVVDTPTNNFCVLDTTAVGAGGLTNYTARIKEAGVKFSSTTLADSFEAYGTIPSNMPYYFEVKLTTVIDNNNDQRLGVIRQEKTSKSGSHAASEYRGDGSIFSFNNAGGNVASSLSGKTTFTDGLIIGIAVDNTNDNDVQYFANGTSQGTIAIDSGSVYMPNIRLMGNGSATNTIEINFGNPSFSISSSNSDVNGYGNFEYSVPSGFYALCTKNLAEYG